MREFPSIARADSFQSETNTEGAREAAAASRPIAACLGMSFWKQRRIGEFLRCQDGEPVFCRTSAEAIGEARARGGAIGVWASQEPPDLAAKAQAAGVPIVRVEDGFLRSVGLGADFVQAVSIIADSRGIYYDPAAQSDLEVILTETDFGAALIARARTLIEQIVSRGISKYNTGGPLPALDVPKGVRRILVPGQVENDRSIICGGASIRSNLELLRRIRAANPDAYIIYKPHPDVEAGHRPGVIPDAEASLLANAIVRHVSTAAILEEVDEVHTLTSLTGFEALLRKRRVVTYGQPFYAGWGLTTDLAPPPRRQRRLSIEELVAGALILYPRYLDPVTRAPCGPELIVERLANAALWQPEPLVLLRRLQGALKPHFQFSRDKSSAADARTDAAAGQRKFLFLQGLPGTFFSRLAKVLLARGHGVSRVNFNAGDRLFWRLPGAVDYRGGAESWPAFLERLLVQRAITDIVLFGDCRPLHQAAIKVATQRDIRVHVFEEGYLRPSWITLEQGGVNGRSPLPRDPRFYLEQAKDLPPWQKGTQMGGSFLRRATEDVLYNVVSTFLAPLYPRYRSHRPWHAFIEYAGWLWRFVQARSRRRRAAEGIQRLFEEDKPYFFFPLQLDCDSQIRHHSSFGRMRPALEHLIASFARHAPPEHMLVLKEHPLDNGLTNWRVLTRRVAEAHGLSERVIYLEAGIVESLIKHSSGVVTVNSTVGLLALNYDRPVIALGHAIYDMPGLTFQGSLDDFWAGASQPDSALLDAFRRVVVDRSVIRGGFFSEEGLDTAVQGAVAKLEAAPLSWVSETPAKTANGAASTRFADSAPIAAYASGQIYV